MRTFKVNLSDASVQRLDLFFLLNARLYLNHYGSNSQVNLYSYILL